MYYRRKIILALLDTFEGSLKKIDFQKLLFLITTIQKKPSFHFVPYKYGSFSFQSYSDIRTLIKYGRIRDSISGNDNFGGKWIKVDNHDYTKSLSEEDKKNLDVIHDLYNNINSKELIKYVYLKFPYYSIRSEIVQKILTKEEYKVVESQKVRSSTHEIISIGYQGKSVDEYFNILIKNCVKILCDVRKNPVSRKYGFSKNQLKRICQGLDIRYEHIPELGISSLKRKNLKTNTDYQKLFKEYVNFTLQNQSKELDKLYYYIGQYKKLAITCFENDHNFCHRSEITNYLKNSYSRNIKILYV